MIRLGGHALAHPALEPLLVDIDLLLPHPENPNNGDVEAVAESIETNKVYRPIQAQRSTRYILCGHTEYHALLMHGATQAPVVWLDVDDVEAKRIMLADNKTARLAQMDHSQELDLLLEVEESSRFGLQGTGYVHDDIEQLQRLCERPLDFTGEDDPTTTWPTLFIQVPPHVKDAYYDLADGENETKRFISVLKKAGWRE